jgi:hypothetical protein
VWDENGLTPEDQRLDEECRRRARLVMAGATLEEANLPPLVRDPTRQVEAPGVAYECGPVGVSCAISQPGFKVVVRFYCTGL